MARLARGEAERVWRERVARWQAGGASAAAFAASEQVSVASLYQWRRRLRSGGEESARPRFVPVTVTSARGVLEVLTGGGCVVRVGPDFDAEHLRAVVAALGSPAC